LTYEFRLPDVGEGLHEAEVLQWFVQEGQVLEADDKVAEIQTDKAAVEITSPAAGRVLSLCGPAGTTVHVGEVLLALDTPGKSQSEAKAVANAEAKAVTNVLVGTTAGGKDMSTAASRSEETVSAGIGNPGTEIQASPAVRKLARDLGVSLALVVPTGVDQRITRADVERALKERRETQEAAKPSSMAAAMPESLEMAEMPEMAESLEIPEMPRPPQRAQVAADGRAAEQPPEAKEHREPIRGIRKRIFENMTKSMYTAPQATGMGDLDATRLIQLRQTLLPFAEEKGIKLTYLPFIVKAVALVLKDFPIFNATVDGEKMEIVFREAIHIGIATATPEGLVVPVLHNAHSKSLMSLAQELQELTIRARDRKLTLPELTGSTFTISSTGAHGGWFATPIVNYPEVAILGVHSIEKRAVVLDDNRIVAQERMTFSLTFDHRVIDGEPAGQFMYRFKEYLERPEIVLAQ